MSSTFVCTESNHDASVDDFQRRYRPSLEAVETCLAAWLESQGPPETLWKAMQHGVLTGGKRLRPMLVIESVRACGGSLTQALPVACALELIHCYSLIHDDLPCMDNDDLRRGRPTVHRAFGEAEALLAGDALLALSFGKVAQAQAIGPEARIALIERLSWAASMGGLVTGQALDMKAQASLIQTKSPESAKETLHSIHEGKTGALFRFACASGPIIMGLPASMVEAYSQFGEALGLLFQIKDDILDEVAAEEQLGKSQGKDKAQDKLTFPAVYGLEGAQTQLGQSVLNCYDQLERCDTMGEVTPHPLAYFVAMVAQRSY